MTHGAVFQKVLIANRGEIALRVARACRELGVKSVAVYSTADADSAVVRFADEAVHIGPPASGRSYLHIPSIIGAAQKTGADAIHPGYGFLSEDPYFAEICAERGHHLHRPEAGGDGEGRRQGDRARPDAEGRPAAPARHRRSRSRPPTRRSTIADEIGYPVIIKAVAGGGGRGMTVVWKPRGARGRLPHDARDGAGRLQGQRRLHRALPRRRRATPRSRSSATTHGNGVYFGERDCSVQRRHQKLIEEAPSIHLTPEMRKDIGEKAVDGALSIGYTGAGTMEFLLDHDGNFAFMEMNARIQVEHPVSEMITAVDLIQEQIRVAAGEPLSVTQDDVEFTGPLDRVPDQRGGPGQRTSPRRRAGSRRTCRRAGRGRASTRTATPAGWSARSTTR